MGVPIVLANIWLTGFLSARIPIKRMTAASALLTGVFIATVVVPTIRFGLFPVLFATGAVLAICLPSCATPLSNAAKAAEQGRVMGNNQALQVAAEALSGLAAGSLAAIIVKLPLSCSEHIGLRGRARGDRHLRALDRDRRLLTGLPRNSPQDQASAHENPIGRGCVGRPPIGRRADLAHYGGDGYLIQR